MNTPRHAGLVRSIALCALLTLAAYASAQETSLWRTAYVKRAFMGELNTPADRTLRLPTPLAFSGTQVRLRFQGSRNGTIDVQHFSLVQAASTAVDGAIKPPVYPITVRSNASFTIGPMSEKPPTASDKMTIPITAGLWYLQEAYKPGAKAPYFYDVDGGFLAASPEGPVSSKIGYRGSMVWRIDVLTTDTRPLILCYGDSITQGYGATPDSGNRYPDLLGQELQLPVLNAGVNGDQLIQSGGLHRYVKNEVAGVDLVTVLLGINDLCRKSITNLPNYTKVATTIVKELRQQSPGVKVVWCTLPPAGGYKAFSDDPAKETLRVAINEWILANKMKADGIIDFAKALADPSDPTRMDPALHKDFIHPNDAGNRVMARTAAPILRQVLAPSALGEAPLMGK